MNIFLFFIILLLVLLILMVSNPITSPTLKILRWCFRPLNQKFCRHNWIVNILPDIYGIFGGMKIYICDKCGLEDCYREAGKRLKRNGLL